MSLADEKPPSRTQPRGGKRFVSHFEVAEDHGVSPQTVLRWIQKREFADPHFLRGATRYWRRADYDRYCATGKWPARSL